MRNQFTEGEIQYFYGEVTVSKHLVAEQGLKFRSPDFFSIITREW